MLVEREPENFTELRFLDEFLLGHKGFVAGGCFKNIFNREPVKDVDVFFRSSGDYIDARAYFEAHSSEYEHYYTNDKVTAFRQIRADGKPGISVELIRTIFGTPEEILNQFDFTVSKFAYYKVEEPADPDDPFEAEEPVIQAHILHDAAFFEHLFRKRLVIDDKIPFPISTFERMIRYIKYGYLPCRETKEKLIRALQETRGTDGISNSLYAGMD